MYKYVEWEVELLHQPALGQDVDQVGHQVQLLLAVDLVEHGRHRHVGQAVAEQGELAEYYLSLFIQNPIRKKTLMSKKD